MKRRDLLTGAGTAALLVSGEAALAFPRLLLSRNAKPFVGMLDGIANLYAVYGANLLLSAYNGPLFNLRRGSDNATLDFSAVANGYPSTSAISTWLNGATGFLVKFYDQTGNSRPVSPASNAAQPTIDLTGTNPVFDFNGTSQEIVCTTQFAAFSQNQSGCSIIAIRRHATTSTGTDRDIAFMSIGTGASSTRMAMGAFAATGTSGLGGRRLDGDPIVRTTGFTNDTTWETEIGVWNWGSALLNHYVNNQSEVANPFETTGSTSNTASLGASIGSTGGAGFFNGSLSMIAFVQSALSAQQVANLLPSGPGSYGLSWTAADTGTYSLAPNLTHYAIYTPDGTTPTQASLTSHRYHNHTRCAYGAGRIWVMSSSSGTNEDAPGQMVVCSSSADGGNTWTAPTLVSGAQDVFSGTGATDTASSGIQHPRCFASYNGNLYAVVALDEVGSGGGTNNLIGLAMFAAQCNSDGSIGSLFRITAPSYTPLDALPVINYDGTLGPALYPFANLFGTWGGSSPQNTASAWVGWASQSGNTLVEPATFDLTGTQTSLLRIWRSLITAPTFAWYQTSNDGGANWSNIFEMNVPNSPAAIAALKLPDGRLALAGNPQDGATSRDPLYLALFNPTTGTQSAIYAVRQGISPTPVYTGTFKTGGAQYPGMCIDGSGNLWISAAEQKETVGMTKIPLAGL